MSSRDDEVKDGRRWCSKTLCLSIALSIALSLLKVINRLYGFRSKEALLSVSIYIDLRLALGNVTNVLYLVKLIYIQLSCLYVSIFIFIFFWKIIRLNFNSFPFKHFNGTEKSDTFLSEILFLIYTFYEFINIQLIWIWSDNSMTQIS